MVHDVLSDSPGAATLAALEVVEVTDLQTILSSLEERVELASRERAAAEVRERAAAQALAEARNDAAAHIRRRAELVTAMDMTAATAEACASRLGSARGELAETVRGIEQRADSIAAGAGDPKVLARLEDTRAMQQALVDAHSRRTSGAETDHAAAERELRQHDLGEADRVGRQLEQLMLAIAAEVDGHLQAVTERATAAFKVLDSRRSLHPREAWSIEFLHISGRFSVLKAAFEKATWPINHARVAIGSTTSQSFESSIRTAVQSWQRGRGEEPDRPNPPPSVPAAVSVELVDDGHDALAEIGEAA